MGVEYNKIKIGSTWLTDDGTETGERWRVEIPNLPRLRMARRTMVQCLAAPQVQLFDLVGETFPMTITLLRSATYEALLTALIAADAAKTAVRILISGTAGDFDFNCLLQSGPEQSGRTLEDALPQVTLTWVIDSINEPEEE